MKISEVLTLAKENYIIFNEWVEGEDQAYNLQMLGYKLFQPQNIITRGNVNCWIHEGIIKENGLVKNQSLDHYSTVMQLAGILIQMGFENVGVNHSDDVDVSAELHGETYGFEYEHPDSHNKTEIIGKKQRGLLKFKHPQELGAYERAVTAFLNAQLIPITRQFVQSIITDIKERGINARLLMLKCDGSVVGITDALKKPIETIFSGPAASLVGASYLSGLETCAVIDVGGTSTDISSICMGVPDLSEEGAVVGGWKTRVKAIRMETTATGGDSHIWIMNKGLFLGPRQVVPLAVAAVQYTGFLSNLKRTPTPVREDLCENIQPTKFFVRSGYPAGELSKAEADVLEVIGDEPISVPEITTLIRKDCHSQTLDSLIKKRLVQAIGFTPTDALHVLGEYTAWNEEASRIGAERLSRLMRMTSVEFSTAVKKRVARNMALHLLSYILTGVPETAIAKILDGNYPAKFKLDIPVVLLGGPVRAHRKELENFVEAEILVPEHAEVGNAVGALVGRGIKRVEILIRPASLISPDKDFLVFTPGSRLRFDAYVEALETATEIGKKLVEDYMKDCGLSGNQVEISVEKKTISPDGWNHPPMETSLLVMGVGMRGLPT